MKTKRSRDFFALLLALFVVRTGIAASTIAPEKLRVDYLVNPLGIDDPHPRLSWIDVSSTRAAKQTAYQILAASTEEKLRAGQGDLWDSGKIKSDQSAQVHYAGKILAATQRAFWAVRVWDASGEASDWSAPASWEMGLLSADDWHGQWIGHSTFTGALPPTHLQPTPEFRRSFAVNGKVKRARAYIIGDGYFEMTINGKRVGDHLLDPGFTRYDRRLLYVTHDVTSELREGENIIGVMLGNGFFNVQTRAAWDFDKAPWRATPRMLVELRIEMEDGRTGTIWSDDKWKSSDSPITFSSIYGGENYDARLEQPGWDTPGFKDDSWQPANLVDAPKGKIVAQAMHPIRITKVLKPVSVAEPAPGVYLFDVGQNLTGNAELNISGPAGTVVTMRYGERLNKRGRLDQADIATHVVRFDGTQQFQTDNYTLKGAGLERWKSRFNYNGFRYVEVTGAPAKLTTNNLTVDFFHSDVPETGEFECSNPILNKLWINGRWSYLCNLFSIPTDCPHREKNGWTGDAQIACEQGLFYQDGITVYEKWINDLGDEQAITGALPGIVPTSGQWGYGFGSGPGWDSAFFNVPWYLYEYYGDNRALIEHYDGLKHYVDYLTSRARDGIVAIGLGDWSPWKAKTSEAVTDTAYYYHDAKILAEVARMLGRKQDAHTYDVLAGQIRADFNKKFYNADTGSYAIGTQTALGCAIYQGLVEPHNEDRVVANLVAAIKRNDSHIDYGFLGSKYVPNALAAHGHADLVYTMITQKTEPSYAWQIEHGATTLSEEWNGNGSQNHTFFGDVNAWMMKNIAGINPDPAVPGFKHILIQPQPVGDLTWAKGSYDSIHGLISTEWTKKGDAFHLKVLVPVNCTATVTLPAVNSAKITENGHPIASVENVKILRTTGRDAMMEIGSGTYEFEAVP